MWKSEGRLKISVHRAGHNVKAGKRQPAHVIKSQQIFLGQKKILFERNLSYI
jgi:hypothetical protein